MHTGSAPADVAVERFTGLLPDPVVQHRRPRWWQELAVVALGYWLYGLARNAIHTRESVALGHGRGVEHLQRWLQLDLERSLNRWVAGHEPVAQVMDYYYAVVHLGLTIAVLVWLFHFHPRVYRGSRTVLLLTTMVALVGFYLYPLAPPRLLSEYGYIDTLVRFHTWGSLADPAIAQHSNQYAAMPSLHVAWALWVGISLFACARRRWVRLAGLAHPMATLVVVLGTANHFVLDAVGAVAAITIGFGAQFALSGHGAFQWAPSEPPILSPAPRPAVLVTQPEGPAVGAERQESACGS